MRRQDGGRAAVGRVPNERLRPCPDRTRPWPGPWPRLHRAVPPGATPCRGGPVGHRPNPFPDRALERHRAARDGKEVAGVTGLEPATSGLTGRSGFGARTPMKWPRAAISCLQGPARALPDNPPIDARFRRRAGTGAGTAQIPTSARSCAIPTRFRRNVGGIRCRAYL